MFAIHKYSKMNSPANNAKNRSSLKFLLIFYYIFFALWFFCSLTPANYFNNFVYNVWKWRIKANKQVVVRLILTVPMFQVGSLADSMDWCGQRSETSSKGPGSSQHNHSPHPRGGFPWPGHPSMSSFPVSLSILFAPVWPYICYWLLQVQFGSKRLNSLCITIGKVNFKLLVSYMC